jgi:hypothetical protein
MTGVADVPGSDGCYKKEHKAIDEEQLGGPRELFIYLEGAV